MSKSYHAPNWVYLVLSVASLLVSITSARADSFCHRHPENIGCHGPGDAYCRVHEDADGCHRMGYDYFCNFHPEAQGCHEAGDDYCVHFPEADGCRLDAVPAVGD